MPLYSPYIIVSNVFHFIFAFFFPDKQYFPHFCAVANSYKLKSLSSLYSSKRVLQRKNEKNFSLFHKHCFKRDIPYIMTLSIGLFCHKDTLYRQRRKLNLSPVMKSHKYITRICAHTLLLYHMFAWY